MITLIYPRVEELVRNTFMQCFDTNPDQYILLIARAEYYSRFEGSHIMSPYMIDFNGDIFHNETIQKFYLQYLNKNYRAAGYTYVGDSGFYDLNVELMIYSHIWESHYFLKTLVRLAHILDGRNYDWRLDVPRKIHDFITKNVTEPLKLKNIELGQFVDECYSSDIRNAVAHAQYNIDMERSMITMFHESLQGSSTISFTQFQQKFLNSIYLAYFMTNYLELYRIEAGKIGLQSGAIKMPNGKYTQIKATMKTINNMPYVRFE